MKPISLATLALIPLLVLAQSATATPAESYDNRTGDATYLLSGITSEDPCFELAEDDSEARLSPGCLDRLGALWDLLGVSPEAVSIEGNATVGEGDVQAWVNCGTFDFPGFSYKGCCIGGARRAVCVGITRIEIEL